VRPGDLKSVRRLLDSAMSNIDMIDINMNAPGDQQVAHRDSRANVEKAIRILDDRGDLCEHVNDAGEHL
jgi:transcriptional/translational regulatory protein YebC/TACO1